MISATDRNALINDPEKALSTALTSLQTTIWTAIPGIIIGVDFSTMTCTVQPAILGVQNMPDGSVTHPRLPHLIYCPIIFPQSGGFALTLPMAIGDEVLVLFSSRCIDSWWQSGTITPPAEMRMHDISDGFAMPGPCSVPKVFPSISTTDAQLRNKAGTTFVSIGVNGKIGFQNTDTSLKQTLTDLQSALNTFMTVLAGFSGGGASVTQAMLQVPAAACETALSTVLTEIGELLQ